MKENSSETPSEPTDMLFGYKVEGFLGEGGMSKVYRVRDEEFDRVLALKVSNNLSPLSMIRFILEAKITGQLQHPLIAPVYKLSVEKDNSCNYTMKRIRGLTLKEILKSKSIKNPVICKKYSRRQLLTIFISLCQTMSYAHTRGVIHRDIKPENIMLGNYGEVYLIDWGLAKTFGKNLYENNVDSQDDTDDNDDATLLSTDFLELNIAESMNISKVDFEALALEKTIVSTISKIELNSDENDSTLENEDDDKTTSEEYEDKTIINDEEFGTLNDQTFISNDEDTKGHTKQGTIFGTPMYMAPEQARGKIEDHDHRSDLYALGVILWEILLETPMRRGFTKRGKEDYLFKISKGHRPDLHSLLKGHRLEPALRTILLKSTHPLQSHRYQSGDELINDLQDFLDGKRKWKLVHEEDFSDYPDQDDAPDGWKVWKGDWCLQDGCLAPLYEKESVIHLDKDIIGDVRLEIEAMVLDDRYGELSPLLAAPKIPIRSDYDDGYCFQFGADHMIHSKIARDGLEIAYAPGEAPTPGKWHHITAELLEEQVRLEVDGRVIVNQRDLFSVNGQRIGFYSWTPDIRIKSIRVYSAGAPMEINYLAVPNILMKAKHFNKANDEYIRFKESHAGSLEADEALYKSIRCLIELSRFNECLPQIEVLKKTPMAPLAWVAESVLFEKLNKVDDEVKSLKAGLKHIDKSFEGWEDLLLRVQVRAKEILDQDDWKSVIILQQALIDSKWLGRYIRGNAVIEINSTLAHIGEHNMSLQNVKKVLHDFDQGTLSVRLKFLEADINEKLANFKKVELLYQEYKNDPFINKILGSDLDRKIGVVYQHQGQHQIARKYWKKSIKAFSNNISECADMLHYIANSYIIDRKYSEAEETYLKISTEYPTIKYKEQFNYDVGIVYCYMHKYEEAIKILQLNEDEGPWGAFGMIGHAYLHQGRFDDAIAYFEKKLKLFADKPIYKVRTLHNLANVYREKGDFSKSLDFIFEILEDYKIHRKEISQALVKRGIVECQMGKFKKAFKTFNDNYQEYPDFRGSYDYLYIKQLGLLLGQNENKNQTINYFRGIELYAFKLCLQGIPGSWKKDERGILITPFEAMRRSNITSCSRFQHIIDLRASFDSAWKPYSSGSNLFLNIEAMHNHFDNMPRD
ncbi:MAG: hypothetical protein COA79_17370 [Planctomycetota bacterium]|nr:MAG: hypothetical protein COA79_17370 [Planctomycetota bacterium]